MTSPPPPVENTENPLFKVPMPGLPDFRPRSLDELRSWIQTERTYWDWALQVQNRVPDMGRQLVYLQECLQAVDNAANAKSPDQTARELRTVQTQLTQRYNEQRCVHSSSSAAKFLESLPDKIVAGHALRWFLRLTPQNLSETATWLGVFRAIAFESGIDQSAVASQAQAFSELVQRVGTEHEALRTQAGALKDQFAEVSQEVGRLHTEQTEHYEEAQSTRQTQFASLVDESRGILTGLKNSTEGTLHNIEETYNKKMSLQAAVTYLRNKAKAHLWLMLVMGVVSLAAGAVFVWAVETLGSRLLAGDKPTWPHIAVAVLVATLCFWLLRLLVRIFLSNLHLATDARNRATLMQTYLALLREGGGLKDDDRALVLKMLFRPFSDGVVKDDATPPSVWDFITRAASGR